MTTHETNRPVPDGVLVSTHAETGHPHVDVPVLLVAIGAMIAVALLAVLVPARAPRDVPEDQSVAASWRGSLSPLRWVVRGAVLVLVVLAGVAGRVGADDELDNLAPALVVGAGLPLLVLGSLCVGSLWRWVDPWDTLARLIAPRDRSTPAGHVWPAVVVALPCLWYLTVWPTPLEPRQVGTVLAAYAIVTVAGCVALGRARWLSSAEPVGLLVSWVGMVPRRTLAGWVPPRGAAALLGVVTGGLVFGLLRRTELWVPVLSDPRSTWWSTVAMLTACLVGAGLAVLAGRTGPPGRALVARSLVPTAAGLLLAVALDRDRLSTSVQLLPGLLGDPLGRGWDLWGSPTEGLVVAPLGATGLVTLQIAVVVIPHLLAAATTPRPYAGDDRLPAVTALAGSVVAGVVAVSLH